MNFEKYIDHTLLKPESTRAQIDNIIEEAKNYHFKSICVNPTHVAYAHEKLADSDVLVCTVIGFPLGANTPEVKAFETTNAIDNGADEIDMVINIGALKDGRYDDVQKDIEAVVKAAQGKTVKVIIETTLLTDDEKVKACELSKAAQATFVKTSTGFAGGGATVADVKLMKETVGDALEVKASGGVRNLDDFKAMIDAGATRIGASAGVQIMQGLESDSDY
ncbi:deoxyribose-phosphate aldolase [Staphylococcus hyicus]|uniref:Deoxyribose-phosphate aldolase n=6 Tax=Staphylococcus hyicus TaxID=1284 RepID=A0ACD5FQH4_STAHY|nr:deoxyribose-phosphate aldolase [Staphylococcus hyicus]AJC94968.1 deoxyribose-phosphate aldolase [Staphylococcus hyicus]AJC95151.1 deoxyribose-phosphate aldolase [Staphylococcus hyicus]MCE5155103.1 deoxyribose-phosphate aldolase [Staphylococcus hyicus]MCO4328755.1 deoxyribose-phosphate aldolase [Staphylococcus hyicus]MCO4337088.1 deoxyribose-phosphate aldolase [Staphylococcus hyicus]